MSDFGSALPWISVMGAELVFGIVELLGRAIRLFDSGMHVVARFMVVAFGVRSVCHGHGAHSIGFASSQFGIFVHAMMFFILANVNAAITCAMGHFLHNIKDPNRKPINYTLKR